MPDENQTTAETPPPLSIRPNLPAASESADPSQAAKAELARGAEPLPLDGTYSVGDVIDGRGTIAAVKRIRGDGEYVQIGSTTGEWIKP